MHFGIETLVRPLSVEDLGPATAQLIRVLTFSVTTPCSFLPFAVPMSLLHQWSLMHQKIQLQNCDCWRNTSVHSKSHRNKCSRSSLLALMFPRKSSISGASSSIRCLLKLHSPTLELAGSVAMTTHPQDLCRHCHRCGICLLLPPFLLWSPSPSSVALNWRLIYECVAKNLFLIFGETFFCAYCWVLPMFAKLQITVDVSLLSCFHLLSPLLTVCILTDVAIACSVQCLLKRSPVRYWCAF